VKLGNDRLVLVHRTPTGQRDRYGKPIMVETFTLVRWCSVTPETSTEPGDQSAPQIKGLLALAPPGTAFDSADAVIYPPTADDDDPAVPWTGPEYEVTGDPGVWGRCVQAHLERAH
jgi:hypothetical protein